MSVFCSFRRKFFRLFRWRKTYPNVAVTTVELTNRLTVWGIFMALGESFAADYISRHAASGVMTYVADCLFSILFIIGLRQCGKSDLVRDMSDLYFYDVLLQLAALALFCFNHNEMARIGINAAILYLKTLRLFWLGLSVDGKEFAGWPVFGPFGLMAYRKRRADPRAAAVSGNHDRVVVLAALLAILLATLIRIDLPEDVKWRLLALPFALMLYLARKALFHLVQGRRLDIDLKAMLQEAKSDAPNKQKAHVILLKQREMTEHFTPEGLQMWRRLSRLNPEAQQLLRSIVAGAEEEQAKDLREQSVEARRAQMQLVNREARSGDSGSGQFDPK